MSKLLCFLFVFLYHTISAQENVQYIEIEGNSDFKTSCNELDSTNYCFNIHWEFLTTKLDTLSIVYLNDLIQKNINKDLEWHYYDYDYDFASKSMSRRRSFFIINHILEKYSTIEFTFILHRKMIKSQLVGGEGISSKISDPILELKFLDK